MLSIADKNLPWLVKRARFIFIHQLIPNDDIGYYYLYLSQDNQRKQRQGKQTCNQCQHCNPCHILSLMPSIFYSYRNHRHRWKSSNQYHRLYGHSAISTNVYPVLAITSANRSLSSDSTLTTSVVFLRCEETTFFTSKFLRIVSLMCASHIPQDIPSIVSTVFTIVIFFLSCQSFLTFIQR